MSINANPLLCCVQAEPFREVMKRIQGMLDIQEKEFEKVNHNVCWFRRSHCVMWTREKCFVMPFVV